MAHFEIEHLDHVAIRVQDINRSVLWYEKVLGLKKYKIDKWGEFPIFMLSGKTGVAIFPANEKDPEIPLASKNIKIDHFAFNVSNENFEKAKILFKQMNIGFKRQDHYYFKSVYLKDPDGHTVELTTLVVSEDEFY